MFILILLCLQNGGALVYAQWTKKDSVWLEKVRSGDEKVRLKPEVQKAIESGTFFSNDKPENKPYSSKAELPISKDFSEYLHADSTKKRIDYRQVPPSVFKLQRIEMDEKIKMKKEAYMMRMIKDTLYLKHYHKLGKLPVSFSTYAEQLKSNVPDGQRPTSVNATIRITFSMEDVLQWIFWKSARDKKRNRKHANAWKTYNSIP